MLCADVIFAASGFRSFRCKHGARRAANADALGLSLGLLPRGTAKGSHELVIHGNWMFPFRSLKERPQRQCSVGWVGVEWSAFSLLGGWPR